MASKINRRIVSVEDISLLPVVTTGTFGTPPDDCAATFLFRCQSGDCTQQLCRVDTTRPLAPARWRRRRLRRALETRAYPTPATQSGEVALRGAASVRCRLGAGAVLGGVAPDSSRSHLKGTRRGRAGGQSKRRGRDHGRGETRSGSTSHTVGSSRPRSSLAASVRSCSSPARPASSRHGSLIVVSWRGGVRPRRRYSSSTA
jgi:hypothetical protein